MLCNVLPVGLCIVSLPNSYRHDVPESTPAAVMHCRAALSKFTKCNALKLSMGRHTRCVLDP